MDAETVTDRDVINNCRLLELVDIVANRNHLSSAVGQRNAAVGDPRFPLH
jgi:hypothetical protein